MCLCNIIIKYYKKLQKENPYYATLYQSDQVLYCSRIFLLLFISGMQPNQSIISELQYI